MSASSAGWESTDTAVRASVDVLELSNGRISVPSNLSHTVIEIGCNGHNLAWDSAFDTKNVEGLKVGVPLSDQPKVLLVSFEPLLDKYANYLAIQSMPLHISLGDFLLPQAPTNNLQAVLPQISRI